MALNAVLQHMKGLLTGLESPYLNPAQAAVMPPTLTDINNTPFIWIWSGMAHEKRQSAPRAMGYPQAIRPGGYQTFTWKIDLALDIVVTMTTPNADQTCPTVHDAVVKVLNTVTIPVKVQDPATGQWTQILTIGEVLDSDFAMLRTTGAAGQALVRFGATITCTIEEKVSWTEGYPA